MTPELFAIIDDYSEIRRRAMSMIHTLRTTEEFLEKNGIRVFNSIDEALGVKPQPVSLKLTKAHEN